MSSEGAIAGRHAVVTGGSRGIGLAVVELLVQRGAHVSVVSRSPIERDQVFVARADVASQSEVDRALGACRTRNGPIAILVNNAGVAQSAPLASTELELWDRTIATNLTGTFLCTRAVLTEMLAARFGRVVNVASIAGLYGAPYIAAYCASKHGVVGFTRAAAAELDGTGVTVNAVCPGYTETEMMQRAIANIVARTGITEAAARERLASTNPQGRIVTADEVAERVVELIEGNRTGLASMLPGDEAF